MRRHEFYGSRLVDYLKMSCSMEAGPRRLSMSSPLELRDEERSESTSNFLSGMPHTVCANASVSIASGPVDNLLLKVF